MEARPCWEQPRHCLYQNAFRPSKRAQSAACKCSGSHELLNVSTARMPPKVDPIDLHASISLEDRRRNSGCEARDAREAGNMRIDPDARMRKTACHAAFRDRVGIRIGRHRRGPVAVTHLRRHVSVAASLSYACTTGCSTETFVRDGANTVGNRGFPRGPNAPTPREVHHGGIRPGSLVRYRTGGTGPGAAPVLVHWAVPAPGARCHVPTLYGGRPGTVPAGGPR